MITLLLVGKDVVGDGVLMDLGGATAYGKHPHIPHHALQL